MGRKMVVSVLISYLHFVCFYLGFFFFFFNNPATTEIYTLSLHDALPISQRVDPVERAAIGDAEPLLRPAIGPTRSEEHTSELQSQSNLVCRLLLEKKKTGRTVYHYLLLPIQQVARPAALIHACLRPGRAS